MSDPSKVFELTFEEFMALTPPAPPSPPPSTTPEPEPEEDPMK